MPSTDSSNEVSAERAKFDEDFEELRKNNPDKAMGLVVIGEGFGGFRINLPDWILQSSDEDSLALAFDVNAPDEVLLRAQHLVRELGATAYHMSMTVSVLAQAIDRLRSLRNGDEPEEDIDNEQAN